MHFTHCKSYVPNLVIKRHNNLVHCVARAIRRIGGSAYIEPRHLRFAPDNRRADIDVFLGADRFLVDCSVRIPKTGALLATKRAAKEKSDRYKAQAEAGKAIFVPFILETFGAWGKEAVAFAKGLRKHVQALCNNALDERELYYRFCSEAAVTLQQGNARALSSALQAAHSYAAHAAVLRFPRSSISGGAEIGGL